MVLVSNVRFWHISDLHRFFSAGNTSMHFQKGYLGLSK